jgi:hypothetical protein
MRNNKKAATGGQEGASEEEGKLLKKERYTGIYWLNLGNSVLALLYRLLLGCH